jgi:hypothetical protein
LTVDRIIDFDIEYQSFIIVGHATFHEDDEAILGGIEWDCKTRQQGSRRGRRQRLLLRGGVLCGECPGQSLSHIGFLLVPVIVVFLLVTIVVIFVVVVGGGGGGGCSG